MRHSRQQSFSLGPSQELINQSQTRNERYCGRIAVVKLGAMVLKVVLYYARGETNLNAATNIVEFPQHQE